MSSGPVAAIVCEGQTDAPILREAIRAVWPDLDDIRCLQPELDEMDRAKGPAGWSEVQAWCAENAGRVDELLDPDIGDPIDLLLIAIDLDIAIEAGIENPPQNLGSYETTRLRRTVEAWLQGGHRRRLPTAVCITTPVMAIEAWIIAALFPRQRSPEALRDPAQWLANRKKLRLSPRNGKPWKELHLYREFAAKVARQCVRVRKACPEAERTLREVEQRRQQTSRRM